MPKTICVTCQTEFILFEKGVNVIEMFLKPPRPYKIWRADLYKCPGCGAEIINGFALGPSAIHSDEDFKEIYKSVLEEENAIVIFDYEKPFVIQEEKEKDAELKKQT
jgi:DNA-directed RNA polymerase subunit RPC12/RpoP